MTGSTSSASRRLAAPTAAGPAWDVQLSGIAVMGDKKLEVREAPAGQTASKVVVKATAIMGDVKVLGDSSAKPVRRTLRAWLTRDDRDRRAIE